MEISPLVIQMYGVLGYLFLANSYFNKEKAKLLIVQIISNIFLTLHFWHLSGISGAICDIVCIVSAIAIFLNDKFGGKRKKLLAVVLIIFLFVTVFTTYHYTGSNFTLQELFPIFATCMIIVSLVSSSKDLIRLIGLVAAIFWLAYGIIFGSYAGIVFEVIIIASTIISYFREKRMNQE